MPTWARVQNPVPVSPSSRHSRSPSAPSPSQSSPAEGQRRLVQPWRPGGQRRSSSAPASRVPKRGQMAGSVHGSGQGPSSRVLGRKPVQQPKHWSPQCSHESASEQRLAPARGARQQRPWMMMRAASPQKQAAHEDRSSTPAPEPDAGRRPGRGGRGKTGSASSFTPPSRSTLWHLQAQSGAKQAAPAGGGRRSNAGPRSKSSSSGPTPSRQSLRCALSEASENVSAPHGSLSGLATCELSGWSTESLEQEAAHWAAAADDWLHDICGPATAQQSDRTMASELRKENEELRALAEKLSEQLFAVERRERWYQSTAHDLLAAEPGTASEAEDEHGQLARMQQSLRRELRECSQRLEEDEDCNANSSDHGEAGDVSRWAVPPRKVRA